MVELEDICYGGGGIGRVKLRDDLSDTFDVNSDCKVTGTVKEHTSSVPALLTHHFAFHARKAPSRNPSGIETTARSTPPPYVRLSYT